MVDEIEDWNGKRIRFVRSRGRSGVVTLLDVDDHLFRDQKYKWPTESIKPKLIGGGRISDFHIEDHSALQSRLGHYCRLQSVRSEDAITWNFFESLLAAHAVRRQHFCSWVLSALGLELEAREENHIALWSRITHPLKPTSPNGPEIDFMMHCGTALILGEAKWLSKVGKGQGPGKDQDQIQLRKKYLELYLREHSPDATIGIVLGLDREGSMPQAADSICDGRRILLRNLRWSDLCQYPEHPRKKEITAYLAWKERWSV